MKVAVYCFVLCGALAAACPGLWAQSASPGDDASEQTKPEQSSEPTSVVAATVDEVLILVAEVEHRVRQELGSREATPEARALLLAEALEQLIAQHKVLLQLQHRGEACTDKELEVEIQRLSDRLARQEKTLKDYCRSLQIPRESLDRMLRWQLSWGRFRQKYMTDENLQRYFDQHQREFDGTQLRVAQILLKKSEGHAVDDQLQRAAEIRQEVVSGQLSFADAAEKYSQSPSGRDGGDLGWISRHAPMPEVFSRAAFQLEEGQVSEPVASPFGVHLIYCQEIKPGQRSWQEVREPLRNAVAEYLFRWLSERPEPKRTVTYTGASPHFKPGTRQLVEDADREGPKSSQ